MNGRNVVRLAREWIGTPYVHQARGPKGPSGGVDCVGMLVGVARELGLEPRDMVSYGTSPHPLQLLEHLQHTCDRVSGGPPMALTPDIVCDWEEGDILVFSLSGAHTPQHAGFATEDGLLHTANSATHGECREGPLTRAYRDKIHSVWRVRWPL